MTHEPDRFSAQGELDAMVADYRGALAQADPFEALCQWYFNNVGCRPDEEQPGLTLDALRDECRDYLMGFANDTGAALPPTHN